MVPKYKRNAQPLEVLNVAEKLMLEIVRITSKEDVFPFKKRILVAEPLIMNCRNALYAMQFANELDLRSVDQQKLRKTQQLAAIQSLCKIMIDIKFAQELLSISLQHLQNIVRLTDETKSLLKAWMKSDAERVNATSQPCNDFK